MKRRIAGDSSTELPPQDLDLDHLTRPANLTEVAHAWSEDVWTERHENCSASWECWECDKRVCPNCHPSPGEFSTCAECFDFKGSAA